MLKTEWYLGSRDKKANIWDKQRQLSWGGVYIRKS